MTGEQFVKLCLEEKEAILREYFSTSSQTEVGRKIQELMEYGVNKDDLYHLINLVLNENYYTLLMGIEGEASLGGKQVCYKLYDEKGKLLNECGEIEETAYMCFMEE